MITLKKAIVLIATIVFMVVIAIILTAPFGSVLTPYAGVVSVLTVGYLTKTILDNTNFYDWMDWTAGLVILIWVINLCIMAVTGLADYPTYARWVSLTKCATISWAILSVLLVIGLLSTKWDALKGYKVPLLILFIILLVLVVIAWSK